jgi:catalase
MNDTDREHLVTNIVAHASDGVTPNVQRRVVEYWTNVDAELGALVARGLGDGNGSGTGVAATASPREAAR